MSPTPPPPPDRPPHIAPPPKVQKPKSSGSGTNPRLLLLRLLFLTTPYNAISHLVLGPPLPSWDLRTTLLVGFMRAFLRNGNSYSEQGQSGSGTGPGENVPPVHGSGPMTKGGGNQDVGEAVPPVGDVKDASHSGGPSVDTIDSASGVAPPTPEPGASISTPVYKQNYHYSITRVKIPPKRQYLNSPIDSYTYGPGQTVEPATVKGVWIEYNPHGFQQKIKKALTGEGEEMPKSDGGHSLGLGNFAELRDLAAMARKPKSKSKSNPKPDPRSSSASSTNSDLGSQANSASSSTEEVMNEWKTAATESETVLLGLHGGGYMTGSATFPHFFALAKKAGCPVWSLDYRLNTKQSKAYPAQIQDAITGYFHLIDDRGYRPEQIAVVGDSAGGGLAAALLQYLVDFEMPLPGRLILLSPWVDLLQSTESYSLNFPYDYLSLTNCAYGASRYVRRDASLLKTGYISPYHADWEALGKKLAKDKTKREWPDTLMLWGDRECFADEDRGLAEKISRGLGLPLRDFGYSGFASSSNSSSGTFGRAGDKGRKVTALAWKDMVHDFCLLPIRASSEGNDFVAAWLRGDEEGVERTGKAKTARARDAKERAKL